ncbi:alpha/beta hydrolase [Sansalvadorimonas sp. 2012CJ34-2]|uniref:Alpha/beta hydrolase n=1 Tax=Parendozoicomonas callyspongiae TaxID=2942213 RepID=A0ABT0PCK9_9GAMM|nr:alpha/beta hydrolase [Sansalvadorimonas sp. 2012CJ34-2]MCL6269084.1 alpha/beta hydrolase [Sansalvadorimonas sp. 2012CJ34-2]
MTKRPPIVLIHGMWSTPSVWRLFHRYLSRQGYTVYMPALRHHASRDQDLQKLGQTSIRDYLADLELFVSALPEKPILIGHSMGGLLAMLLAGKRLASAAVLLAPAAPRGFYVLNGSVLKTFAAVIGKWRFWRKAMKLSPRGADYALFNGQPDEVRAALYQDMVHESGRVAAEIGFWPLDMHSSTQLESKPDCPVFILVGENDRITPAPVCEKVAQHIGAQFQELENHAHWLPSEPGWEIIAAQCEAWLQLEGVVDVSQDELCPET